MQSLQQRARAPSRAMEPGAGSRVDLSNPARRPLARRAERRSGSTASTGDWTTTERRNALAALHTTRVDSRNGYQEAVKDAGPDGLASLLKSMIALHQSAIVELEPLVRQAGAEPDADGSFMSTVHRTVISLQSMLTGLDETVLPGFIDGETRILER